MVELICRNEPQHFLCLYNILKLFDARKDLDVESVYVSMRSEKKCMVYHTKSHYCPVSIDQKPCALIRKSYGSIIREMFYALEALNFVQRKRDFRKLIFTRTSLGSKASKFFPSMLSQEDIIIGSRETDLTKKSSRGWIKYCKEGLTTYGPFLGYLWKLKNGKKNEEIGNEVGERAVNTFRLWARECGFVSDKNKIKVSNSFFENKVRIRNWITRKFKNVPPPYQEETAKLLFNLKKAMINEEDVDISLIKNKKKREEILLNLENTGIILIQKDDNLVTMRNDFDADEFLSSIKNEKTKESLLSFFSLTAREKIDEEIANEIVDKEAILYPEEKIKDELLKFIEKRSKENAKKSPPTVLVKGEKPKRDYKLYAALKKYYDYKCQADGYTFKKRYGGYYCEIAHIQEFASSKDDTKDNILVLCANCHKALDHGCNDTREKILKKVKQTSK